MKSVKSGNTKVIGVFCFGVVLSFQNCTQFAPMEASKTQFLAQNSVLHTQAAEGGGVTTLPPNTTETNNEGMTTPNNPPPLPPAPPMDVQVTAFCADNLSGPLGGNVSESQDLSLHFIDAAGVEACVYKDPELQSKMVSGHTLEIKHLEISCSSLAAGTYTVELRSPTSLNLLQAATYAEITNTPEWGSPAWYMFYAEAVPGYGSLSPRPYKVKVTRPAGAQIAAAPADEISGMRPVVVYAHNPGGFGGYQAYSEQPYANGCNYTISPLLVQLRFGKGKTEPIELTSPLLGRLFDILGENSFPVAHAKKLISWFTPNSAARNYFIVRPSSGAVDGINELFGNNTRGPDGKFADNGYEALKKYDGRLADGTYGTRDGLIDSKDLVYNELRLWSDENTDGIAQPSELHTLAEMDVESIDLAYDSGFLESDKYGNETRFKSVLRTRDGRLHLMYDLWFVVR